MNEMRIGIIQASSQKTKNIIIEKCLREVVANKHEIYNFGIYEHEDVYLFGRINNGNAISYPLGVNWGWTAEINFKETLNALFCEPFGIGYPSEEAERKKHDSEKLKKINVICKKNISEVLALLDKDIVTGALNYDRVYDFIMNNGADENLKEQMSKLKHLWQTGNVG